MGDLLFAFILESNILEKIKNHICYQLVVLFQEDFVALVHKKFCLRENTLNTVFKVNFWMPIYSHKYGFLQLYTLEILAILIWQFSFFPLSRISILIQQSSDLPFHHLIFIFLSVMEIFDKTNKFVLLDFLFICF